MKCARSVALGTGISLHQTSALSVLVVMAVALPGCVSSTPRASGLQRLNATHPAFRTVTRRADAVSRDALLLSRAMRHDSGEAIRIAGRRLMRDARDLGSTSARAARMVTSVHRAGMSGAGERYTDLLLVGLTAQSKEAHLLYRVGRLASGDPFVVHGGDARTFLRLYRSARIRAATSVGTSRTAQTFRARHKNSLRFVPVGETGG